MQSDYRCDSPWSAVPGSPPQIPPSGHFDVAIVGAGIAGLSVAYRLSLEGKRVVVLDDGEPGGGQTGRTTAHLASAIDDRFVQIARIHGADGARLAAESHAAAIDCIEQTAVREGIDCAFARVDGFLLLGPGDDQELLDQELAAARDAGLVVQKIPRVPMLHIDSGPALQFARQAQCDPMRYLAGLVAAIERRGGVLAYGVHVRAVEDGEPVRIEAGDHAWTADAAVVATNSPFIDRFALHTKQAPYVTYAVGIRVPRDRVPRALFWDTAEPYHYVRLRGEPDADGQDLLIVGGEDHKTGQQREHGERFDRLEAWARLRFPMLGERVFTWSGQVLETIDGLAFLGRNPGDEHVFLATGDSGMGMTHGTIAGLVIADLILGRENPWAALYDPARKRLGAAPRFLRENVNAALQYAAWLSGSEVASVEQIPLDSGAVIRRGIEKVAVYRDPDGNLHTCSAACPHLGGVVCWNDIEKTWDCPLHGSRFDAHGVAIQGPANTDLASRTEARAGGGASP